jgi:AcrR family transcriptional regulator
MMQKRSENTRARLLESALKHFAVKGYDATSVDDICAAANVSKGAFYHHFESKQALFLSLLNAWLGGIDGNLAALHKATVPETLLAMTEMLPGILAAASDQLPMFLEFWLQASRDEKVWRASIEPYRHFRDYFAGLIAQGTREGSLKGVNPELAGQIILSMAVGILLQALIEPQGANWEKTANQGMEIIMEGLAR